MDSKSIQDILNEQRQQSEIFKKSEHAINTTIANKLKSQDPNIQEKQKLGQAIYQQSEKAKENNKKNGIKNAANPQWHQNRQQGFLKVSQTKEYRQKRKELQQLNLSNDQYVEKHRQGVKNWLTSKQGIEGKKSAAEKRRLSILDIDNNILYYNLKEAANVYKVHTDTFRKNYIKAQPNKFKQMNYQEVLEWKIKNSINKK